MEYILVIICIFVNALILWKMIKKKNKQGVLMGILIIGICFACLTGITFGWRG